MGNIRKCPAVAGGGGGGGWALLELTDALPNHISQEADFLILDLQLVGGGEGGTDIIDLPTLTHYA